MLPSSIHEMIIMPENATMSRKELCEMVTEVNAQYVEQDEVLSDAVYYYSCVNKTLQICNGYISLIKRYEVVKKFEGWEVITSLY